MFKGTQGLANKRKHLKGTNEKEKLRINNSYYYRVVHVT